MWYCTSTFSNKRLRYYYKAHHKWSLNFDRWTKLMKPVSEWIDENHALVSRCQTAFSTKTNAGKNSLATRLKSFFDRGGITLTRYMYSLVPRPLFFRFFILVMEKRVWWISVGHLVLQTPRFWESLIGVDNHKGLFDEVSITIACSSVVAMSSNN